MLARIEHGWHSVKLILITESNINKLSAYLAALSDRYIRYNVYLYFINHKSLLWDTIISITQFLSLFSTAAK